MVDHWHLYVDGRLEYSGTAENVDAYLLWRNLKPGERVAVRSALDLSELPPGLLA